jgi:HSP20 family protein
MRNDTIQPHVYESNGNLVVNAELAGLKPEDVDIGLTDDRLTIKGNLQTEDGGERGNVFYRERRYGNFERSFSLPTGSDIDAIDAGFENGVLTVTLPNRTATLPNERQKQVQLATAAHKWQM